MYGGRAVLEIPLKDTTQFVNIQHVGGNRFVLETRGDYVSLGEHIAAWTDNNHFSNDEQYKAYVERSVVSGGQWYASDAKDGNKALSMTGSFYGRGNGWNPYYAGYGNVYNSHAWGHPLGMSYVGQRGPGPYGNGQVAVNPNQTDESVVFATKETRENLDRTQQTLEELTRERMQNMDKQQFNNTTRYEGLANSKPWMELEPKFFEEPRFLFTSDSTGNVRQWSLRDSTEVANFEKKLHNSTIYAITSTRNSKYFFTSDQQGNVKQILVGDGSIVKDFGKVFKAPITAMQCSPDSRYLLIGDENGHLIQFDCETQKLVKSYGKVLPGAMLTMAITPDSSCFIVAGSQGHVKQYS